MVYYVLGKLVIGVTCPSKVKGVATAAGDACASPWVIAIQKAGILTSAWSAGNSYLYMSSRSLYSLAVAQNAPNLFTRCNRWGLPYYAILASGLFAPLAYLDGRTQAGVVFDWFISLTNTAGFLS